jgi:carbohydrate kinase (thermoresistant glucokinase family)
MIVVVMGVTGSGKSTIGEMLAEALRVEFLDGDWLHSDASREKLRRGIPLTDADRAPWLAAIHARMSAASGAGRGLVVACSALKKSYRATLAEGVPVRWVYLKGSAELLEGRVRGRQGHFVKAELLASQLKDLEEPDYSAAIVVDIAQSPRAIVSKILADLR